jgi:undecaprenyl-diphosphatase
MGLVQGPAEVLPVSSSGHLVLLGSDDKAFEVFAHAGTAAALFIALPPPRLRPLTVAPAAIAGLVLEGPIERRLGTRSVAIAQIMGGLALLLADTAPQRRSEADAGARDDLLIGLAQASALVPGVSLGGATITAARLLGFRREAASRISREAALPVLAGATALKLARLRGARRPTPAYAVGFAAAFASGLAVVRLVPRIDRLPSYTPIAVYRIALGVIALRFMRLNGRHG